MGKAEELFAAPGHPYNCAQSVAAGAGHEELVPELASCGGGRAPEGLCGALHAALRLAPAYAHSEIKRQFEAGAGALTCRAIKGTAHTPCAKCVALAADLLAQATGDIR